MRNILIVLASYISILIFNYLGHVVAPFSILLTPILIGFLTWIIVDKCSFHLIIKTLILASLIILNDILIRLIAGGNHDSEGNGWIILFMFFGILICGLSLLIIGIIRKQIKVTLISLVLPILIVYIYLDNFSTLGLIWEKPTCKDIKESKIDNRYITDLHFNDNRLVYKSDSVNIQGWIEKKILIDNSGFSKKIIDTKKYNGIIKMNGCYNDSTPFNRIYYKIDNPDINGASPIEKTVTFGVNNLNDTIKIYFFKDLDDTVKNFKLIKEIKTVANTGYTQYGL